LYKLTFIENELETSVECIGVIAAAVKFRNSSDAQAAAAAAEIHDLEMFMTLT